MYVHTRKHWHGMLGSICPHFEIIVYALARLVSIHIGTCEVR